MEWGSREGKSPARDSFVPPGLQQWLEPEHWLRKGGGLLSPRFLGRAPMGMSFWKTSLGCVTSLKLAEVVARSQQPTHPPLWMEAILSACCRTSQPAHRAQGTEGEGSSTPALWYQLTLQPMCTLFVSRKSRNASVVYKTVSSPSRIWLLIKGGQGQAGKKDKTPSAE